MAYMPYICGNMYVSVHMHECRWGQLSAVSPLLPCEAQRLKPGHEAWQPAPLPAEALQRL